MILRDIFLSSKENLIEILNAIFLNLESNFRTVMFTVSYLSIQKHHVSFHYASFLFCLFVVWLLALFQGIDFFCYYFQWALFLLEIFIGKNIYLYNYTSLLNSIASINHCIFNVVW